MPAIGEHRVSPTTGKTEVWAGDNYGYQSPESYRLIDNIPGNADPAKEQVDGAVNNRSTREKFLGLLNIPNTIEAWSNEADGINERTGYVGPSFEGAYSNINLSAAFGGPILPATTKWKNKETGEIEEKPGFSAGPVVDQMLYGGTAGVLKSVANLAINFGQRLDDGNAFNDGPQDPASTQLGAAIEKTDRAIREGSPSLELPEDRPADAAFAENLGGEITTSVGGALYATRAIGARAFTNGGFARLSPWMQKTLRWASGVGIESGISTVGLADQNLEGNITNLTGGPLAVTPTDDNLTATLKALLPNYVLEGTLAGGFAGAQKGVSSSLNATVPNIQQWANQRRATQEILNARLELEQSGQQLQVDDTTFEFPKPPEPAKPEQAIPPVEVDVDLQQGKVTAKPAPVEEPTAPEVPQQAPATMQEVDELLLGKPEVDTAVVAVDRLGDDQLRALDGDGPVLDELEGQLQQQADTPAVEGLAEIDVFAPRQNVADGQVPFAEQWEELPTEQLLGYASPGANPRFFREVEQISGRDFAQFTRRDVIDGLKSLEEQGIVALPNRMQPGVQLMPVTEIAVDPARFQFKEGVNDQGQQLGNSLEGVDRWNPDAEGEISVWTDKADGRTYVINGHNRLAKARELGIPTVRVRQILAGDAGQARALGAIENISQGGGTAFDAAKFIREAGIKTPAELEAAGIPLSSGTGTQGLALSRLPDGLFQEAIDGTLPLGRALKLGGSNLTPENMIRIARLGETRNMSERGFQELIDMADSAPEVMSDQVDLFGNTELLDTMTIKAELAAKVRAQVIGRKNLFGKVSKNQAAEQLGEAGTTVNVSAAQIQRDLLKGLERQFDADKYMTGTAISKALNLGTEEIAGGANEKAVVTRIVGQITQSAEGAPPAPAPRAPEPEPVADPAAPLTAGERQDLKRKIVQRAIDNSEVRPSETPTPELPDGPRDMTDPVQMLEDEVRLAGEFQRQADVNEFATRRAVEKNTGFDEMPLDQKKENGMLDGWDTPPAVTRQGFDPLEETISNPNERFTLPGDVAKSKPRFGMARLVFQDDLDRAAYIIRNSGKKSKGEDRIIAALTEQGYDIGAVRRLGDDVKKFIQDVIEESTGSRRAPQEAVEIEVPRSEIDLEMVKPTAEGNARAALSDSLKRASKPITIKTPQRSVDIAAQGLASWANTGTPDPLFRGWEDALPVVRKKGAILNLEKVDGLNYDEALNQRNMGIYKDDFYKTKQAVMEFYGLDDGGGGGGRNFSSDDDTPVGREWFSWIDMGSTKPGAYRRGRAELQEDLTMAIQRVAGRPLGGIDIRDGKQIMQLGSEWGKPKKGPVGGWYDSTNDIIVLADFQNKSGRALMSTAYHEAFHRIQYNVLSEKDMNVLNSAWGRLKMGKLDDARPKKLLETQAVAFQRYAEMRARGIENPNEWLIKKALADVGIPEKSFTGKALTVLRNTWETIIDSLERVNNLVRGNGYRTAYDLFDDAFSGKLKDRRKWVQLENSMADLQLEKAGRFGDPIDPEVGNFLDAIERSETLEDWRNNASFALKQHQEFYAKEIEALKTQAMAGGC